MKHMLTWLCFSLLATLATAQLQDPLSHGYYCDTEPSVYTDWVNPIGTTKVLWIMCAPDSGALRPLDSLSILRPDTCPPRQRVRVMYPSTYRLPTWARDLFDSTTDRSLTNYYVDQSFGHFRLVGEVVGRNDSTLFLSDPDTAVRPLQPFTCWGNNGGSNFFLNIMEKVDSVLNLADYDVNHDGNVDQVFFHIYGLSEDGRFQGTGGVACGLAATYTSPTDTLPDGRHIRVHDGVTFWSPSPEAYEALGWNAARAERQSYWEAHYIAAHEFGHNLNLWHLTGPCHLACGNFGPMSGGSFVDPVTWVVGPTSPYDLEHRIGMGWVNPALVDHPLMNLSLGDHMLTGQCLKIPTYTTGASDQYFLVQTSTRSSLWESCWPAEGIQIHHVNPMGSQWNPRRKQLDMELSSGLYDWIERSEPANPRWGCPPPCPLCTGENLGTPNVASGLDQFDFQYLHTDTFPIPNYLGGRVGDARNYFTTDGLFDFQTNPSSNAHATNQSEQQTRPSMVCTKVISVNPGGNNCVVNAWSRHWSGTVTTNALWLDSVVVDNSLMMASGTVLTIQPGTVVRVASERGIYVSGRIIAQGTEEHPIIFDCSQPNGRWSQLRISSDDPGNVLEHVIIRHATYGLMVPGRVNADHVLAENCWVGGLFVQAAGEVENSVFRNNERFGVWIYSSPGFAFHHNLVESNGGIGLEMWRVPAITIHHNVIRANSGAESEPGMVAGVHLLCSAADLNCNEISENFASGLLIEPQSYAYMGTESGNQLVDNVVNTDYQLEHGQITLVGGIADLACGWNTIMDHANERWLIYSDMQYPRPFNWDATVNYWGTEDIQSILSRTVGPPLIEPILTEPWNCDDPVQPPQCALRPDELMFHTAWEQERTAQFLIADSTYKALIEQYPESEYAKLALDRVLFCEKALEWSWAQVREYFQTLAEDSSKDSCLVTLALSNAAWCLAEMEDYDGAYYELDSLLNHKDPGYERTTLALQRLFVELKENSYELLRARPGGSGSGSPRTAGTLDQVERDFDAKLERISHSVDSVLAAYHHSMTPPPRTTASLPKVFALYQNYPNPFNPNTEIRFDLPEAVKVQIKVYNTMGQEVTTLVDEIRSAGAHRIIWDSRSASGVQVASGVYVYQIKAGDFVDSKKMVLIR